jgi:hypothetical protein
LCTRDHRGQRTCPASSGPVCDLGINTNQDASDDPSPQAGPHTGRDLHNAGSANLRSCYLGRECGIKLWRSALVGNDLDAEIAIAIYVKVLDGLLEPGGGDRSKDCIYSHEFVPVRAPGDRFRSCPCSSSGPDGKPQRDRWNGYTDFVHAASRWLRRSDGFFSRRDPTRQILLPVECSSQGARAGESHPRWLLESPQQTRRFRSEAFRCAVVVRAHARELTL